MEEKNKKEEIKNWLKNPYNLILILILIFALVFRGYYFDLTKNQPIWWDEAEYMSAAKTFAGITDLHRAWNYRLPGFPLLASLFFMAGVKDDAVLKFFLSFIPSLIVILLSYLLIKEMYPDRRIALISAAILTVLWEHVFWSNRFHTENFSLIFEFLAMIVLFVCYVKKKDFYFIKSKYALIWIILFSIISMFFRPGNLPFIPVIVAFIILIKIPKIFNKKNLIPVLIAVALIVGGLIYVIFAPKTGFLKPLHFDQPISWHVFSVFNGFYQSLVPNIPPVLLYALILGVLVFIVKLALIPEKLKKTYTEENTEENLTIKSDILNILLIASTLSLFIFFLRPPPGFEYRWFFPMLPGMLAFTSKGIINFSEYFGKLSKKKTVTIVLIVIILGAGVYTQLDHADKIIKMKLTSYQEVKDSGLWVKQNSDPGDILISASVFQHSYYSERTIIVFYENDTNKNESEFINYIKKKKPKYMIVSVFEPSYTPEWAYTWPQAHPDLVDPVKIYFADQEQTQPILIIYRFKNL